MSKYYISKDKPSPYLIHSGVKGMKHGVRKYQYTDGSLTPLGRVHYGVGPSRGSNSEAKSDKAKRVRSTSRNKSAVNVNKDFTEAGQSALKRARENDEYDLDFLESIQNEDYALGSANKEKRLSEYTKYLKDPVAYMTDGESNTRDQLMSFSSREESLLKNMNSAKRRVRDKADKEYWDLMMRQTDTSNISDKKLKAEIEKEILEGLKGENIGPVDLDTNYKDLKKISLGMALSYRAAEVTGKSGEGDLTENFKKGYEAYKNEGDRETLVKAVLKDLGYETTPDNIRLGHYLVFEEEQSNSSNSVKDSGREKKEHRRHS